MQSASMPMQQLHDDEVNVNKRHQRPMAMQASGNVQQRDQDEVSDDEECGDTDEHIIHSAANFNPSGMMSASDSGATSHLYGRAGGMQGNGEGVSVDGNLA